MRCMQCGREIADEAEFCQYCGHSVHGKEGPVLRQSKAKSDSRIVLAVIAVAVALVVIMAFVYITMMLGVSERHTTPSATYYVATIDDGVMIDIRIYPSVPWSDVKIRLTDGENSVYWSPDSKDLDGEEETSVNLSVETLGALSVTCTVYDISGNGVVDEFDCFSLTTCSYSSPFSSTTYYRAVLIYEPTDMLIGREQTFYG